MKEVHLGVKSPRYALRKKRSSTSESSDTRDETAESTSESEETKFESETRKSTELDAEWQSLI